MRESRRRRGRTVNEREKAFLPSPCFTEVHFKRPGLPLMRFPPSGLPPFPLSRSQNSRIHSFDPLPTLPLKAPFPWFARW